MKCDKFLYTVDEIYEEWTKRNSIAWFIAKEWNLNDVIRLDVGKNIEYRCADNVQLYYLWSLADKNIFLEIGGEIRRVFWGYVE